MDGEGWGIAPRPGEDGADRPGIVVEAEEVLVSYAWQLSAGGALALVAWAAAAFSGAPVPLLWLLLVAVGLLLLYAFPVTREPRLSRDVLRRWDQQRVERALQSAGVSADPRLEVAESMADRVVRHPAVEQRVRDAATALVSRLHRLLNDLGRVEYLAEARVAMQRGEDTRSISDLQDLLDARVGEVLGQLAALHGTVVLRDASALARVVGEVEDLVRELEAEQEVERLLLDAETE